MDTVAYFSWNPAGLFSKDNKGSVSGAANYSGQSKANKEHDAQVEAEAAAAGQSSGSAEGVISDEEAQKLAKKRLYRSGSVITSPLGEDVTPEQLAGTRLT